MKIQHKICLSLSVFSKTFLKLVCFLFQCDDGELKKVFAEFGDVMEVSIPKKANGKKLGFGIIQFSAVESAARAVEEMNGKSILGLNIFLRFEAIHL